MVPNIGTWSAGNDRLSADWHCVESEGLIGSKTKNKALKPFMTIGYAQLSYKNVVKDPEGDSTEVRGPPLFAL